MNTAEVKAAVMGVLARMAETWKGSEYTPKMIFQVDNEPEVVMNVLIALDYVKKVDEGAVDEANCWELTSRGRRKVLGIVGLDQ